MDDELNHRARALLRAVAAGRAEVTHSQEPDLRVDGLLCSDQSTARQLAHAGLVRPAARRGDGPWVPAEITPEGLALLS